jgi:drug/metabolite transporter (DMT)-like permease
VNARIALPLGAIVIAQTCGGLSSVLTKLALDDFSPWSLVAYRQLLAVVILLAMARNAVATGFQSVVVVRFSLPEPSSGLCGAAAMASLGIMSLRRRRRPERAFAN